MIKILTIPPPKTYTGYDLKTAYIASVQRKQLSRYKIKKQTGIIAEILNDPLLS